MRLHAQLEKKLGQIYAPSSRVDDAFRGKDIAFVTNEHGEPVTLFIGKRRPDGVIAGERYVRILHRQADGVSIRHSHWELKGKT